MPAAISQWNPSSRQRRRAQWAARRRVEQFDEARWHGPCVVSEERRTQESSIDEKKEEEEQHLLCDAAKEIRKERGKSSTW